MSLAHMASASHLVHHHDDEHKYPTSAAEYDVFQEIGSGAFAKVYRARVRGTDEEVAIKVIDLDQFNTNWDEIRKEILIMRSVNHPNVVKIYCSFVEEQDLWIVMPLLVGGSCAGIMKQIAPTGFKDEALLATILKEALEGLVYLHKDGRIHRDIKAGNILISASGNVELADFGVAGTLMEGGDKKKNRQTFTGTPCWMAPEVMEQTNGYDTKADIWSFGITAMELGYGRAPYAKFQPMKVLLMTLQDEPPTCDIYNDDSYAFSKDYHKLIAKCLKKDPSERPNAAKLLQNKFFRKARDSQYIVEKLISKLPATSNERTVTLEKKDLHPVHESDDKTKPVSVESFVFESGTFTRDQLSDPQSSASSPLASKPNVRVNVGSPAATPTNSAPATATSTQAQAPATGSARRFDVTESTVDPPAFYGGTPYSQQPQQAAPSARASQQFGRFNVVGDEQVAKPTHRFQVSEKHSELYDQTPSNVPASHFTFSPSGQPQQPIPPTVPTPHSRFEVLPSHYQHQQQPYTPMSGHPQSVLQPQLLQPRVVSVSVSTNPSSSTQSSPAVSPRSDLRTSSPLLDQSSSSLSTTTTPSAASTSHMPRQPSYPQLQSLAHQQQPQQQPGHFHFSSGHSRSASNAHHVHHHHHAHSHSIHHSSRYPTADGRFFSSAHNAHASHSVHSSPSASPHTAHRSASSHDLRAMNVTPMTHAASNPNFSSANAPMSSDSSNSQGQPQA